MLINTWKIFVADYFYGSAFYSLYFFNCTTLSFIKLIFFFEKLKKFLEACFLHIHDNTVELLQTAFLFRSLYEVSFLC